MWVLQREFYSLFGFIPFHVDYSKVDAFSRSKTMKIPPLEVIVSAIVILVSLTIIFKATGMILEYAVLSAITTVILICTKAYIRGFVEALKSHIRACTQG
jgi:hypothetical protein